MGEVMTRLQVFHRLGLFLGIAAGMSFYWNGGLVCALGDRSGRTPALRAFGDSGGLGRRREKMGYGKDRTACK